MTQYRTHKYQYWLPERPMTQRNTLEFDGNKEQLDQQLRNEDIIKCDIWFENL